MLKLYPGLPQESPPPQLPACAWRRVCGVPNPVEIMADRTEFEYILLPDGPKQHLIDHCQRKLAEQFLDNEAAEKKAYGLVAGRCVDGELSVIRCAPLLKNARTNGRFKPLMDQAMHEFAVPSITPMDRRGWVADPEELLSLVKEFNREGLRLIGTYHMHRVAWQHDPLRDTPTRLDTILGAKSRLVMFIISMVDPTRPIIRAFYEGHPEMEITISSEQQAPMRACCALS